LDKALAEAKNDSPKVLEAASSKTALEPSVRRGELPKFNGNVDESKIVNPIDPKASPQEKIRQLRSLSAENEPIVDTFIKKLDEEFGTTSRWNHKKPETILEKSQRPQIISDKPWFGIQHVRDAFRFMTELNDIRNAPAIFQRIKDNGFEIVKRDIAKMLSPKPFGFRFVAADLRMPNGQLVEFYMPTPNVEKFKNARGHQLFENWREKSKAQIKGNYKNYLADIKESFEGYRKAWKEDLANMNLTEKQVAEILGKIQ
jgi:hypothetical protein